jgi:hypothetical protein
MSLKKLSVVNFAGSVSTPMGLGAIQVSQCVELGVEWFSPETLC